ncbi:MAG: hypothetical protein LWW82_10915 [Comamonadaceae bacterium]|nr:hypothetical protein [Comamonadaceae bacterium]
MSCAAMAGAHPRTLLGAAWAMLQPAADVEGQHLQAHAACRLGDYQRARRLWEALAQDGDGEALEQLVQLARRAQ